MYSAVEIFGIFLILSAAVNAAPVIFQHVSEVSLIISDSCMGQSDLRVTPSVAMSNAIAASTLKFPDDAKSLNNLDKYLNDISNLSQKIQKTNTQLYVMTQLFIFAYYFRSQERDDAYPDDVKVDLSELKNNLYRAMCQLKHFLLQEAVPTCDIIKYISDDHKQNWFSLYGETITTRRAVVMAELNILSQFLESFTYNSTSFATKSNIFATSNCG